MKYLATKTLPRCLRDALESVGYRRQDIQVSVVESTSMSSPSGFEGNRGFVLIVNLGTGEVHREFGSWGGANPFSPHSRVDRDHEPRGLNPGIVVVKGNTGGRGAFATLYVHPQGVAPLLPAGDAQQALSEIEDKALYVFKTYKAAARKSEFARLRVPKATIEALIERGLISRNKAGAVQLTTAGRNAYSGKSYY